MDEKTHKFKEGFDELALLLGERYFTSVHDFSSQLSHVIANRLAENQNNADTDIDAIHNQLNEVKPGTAQHMALTQEQKDIKRLAKRILKAVKEPLEDALRKEAELKGQELEEQIRKLDAMGMFASKSLEIEGETNESPVKAVANGKRRSTSDASANAGASPEDEADVEMEDADERTDEAVIHLNIAGKEDTVPIPNNKKKTRHGSKATSCASSSHDHAATAKTSAATAPLSPPISTDSLMADQDPSDVFASGGIPWYLTPFDPEGTTVHEERYTGRAVLRDMSEELSDMDEDTLTELAVSGVGETPNGTHTRTTRAAAAATADASVAGEDGSAQKKKQPKKKGRRQQWTKPRVR